MGYKAGLAVFFLAILSLQGLQSVGAARIGTSGADPGGEMASDWSCDSTLRSLCVAVAAAATGTCVTAQSHSEDSAGLADFNADTESTACGGASVGVGTASADTIPSEMTVQGCADQGPRPTDCSQTECSNEPLEPNGCARGHDYGGDDTCTSASATARGTNSAAQQQNLFVESIEWAEYTANNPDGPYYAPPYPLQQRPAGVHVEVNSDPCTPDLAEIRKKIQQAASGPQDCLCVPTRSENLSDLHESVQTELRERIVNETIDQLRVSMSEWPTEDKPQLEALRQQILSRAEHKLSNYDGPVRTYRHG